MLTSFVLNSCFGQLSGDPAPGRSPGPPELKSSSGQLASDNTTPTATTSYIPTNFNANDRSQNHSRFNEPPSQPQPPNDSVINSRRREHMAKSHEYSASTHPHKFVDKTMKTTSKAGAYYI